MNATDSIEDKLFWYAMQISWPDSDFQTKP